MGLTWRSCILGGRQFADGGPRLKASGPSSMSQAGEWGDHSGTERVEAVLWREMTESDEGPILTDEHFHSHLRRRMEQRGVTEDEVRLMAAPRG